MRVLLLADIHANAASLEAVLADASSRGFDRAAFLGDAVGYGPNPGFVLDRLEDLNATCILGNHDTWLLETAAGLAGTELGLVGEALRWQLAQLEDRHLRQLRAWPHRAALPLPGRVPVAELLHGSPRDDFEYLDSIALARGAFGAWPGKLAFVGHTHLPGVYATLEGPVGEWVKHHGLHEDHLNLRFPPLARWIVNPGSAGQPRDGDPRASYAIYDDAAETVSIHRVAYDVDRTMAEARAAGLPDFFALRLAVGR
ncbi:MAG TPA: metallophosphoesterase family protein [Deinococcales bacterium]|nr:metallophosphoesterase family protein [Deinococcales bacterium]